MSDRDHAIMILQAAKKDMAALAGMADRDLFADEIFGFHAQQAVEKALKAWLSLRGVEYPRTHDLELLINLLCENGAKLPATIQIRIDLTDYAVQFRYETYDNVTAGLDRAELYEQVAALWSFVASQLRT